MFVLAKYKNKWAVLDTAANVYYFIGCGRTYCEKKVRELNAIITKLEAGSNFK
jgi:hypothetical protein